MQRQLDLLINVVGLGAFTKIVIGDSLFDWQVQVDSDGRWSTAFTGSPWECFLFESRYAEASAKPEVITSDWGDPVCCN